MPLKPYLKLAGLQPLSEIHCLNSAFILQLYKITLHTKESLQTEKSTVLALWDP